MRTCLKNNTDRIGNLGYILIYRLFIIYRTFEANCRSVFNFHVRAGARRSNDNVNDGDWFHKVPNKYPLSSFMCVSPILFSRIAINSEILSDKILLWQDACQCKNAERVRFDVAERVKVRNPASSEKVRTRNRRSSRRTAPIPGSGRLAVPARSASHPAC